MPVTFQIDEVNRLIHTKCTGRITVDDVIAHFRKLEKDPSIPDRMDVLLEVRDGVSVPKPDELRAVAGEIARIRHRIHFDACAIVAGSQVLFGMMRMFEVFAEDYFRKTRVFLTVEEAEIWLTSQRRVPKVVKVAGSQAGV
jgi:hypothetical protein